MFSQCARSLERRKEEHRVCTWVVTFGTPQNLTPNGLDGRELCFPYSAVEEQYIGTPYQSANTVKGRVVVKAAGTLIDPWGLEDHDLVKALYQLAKDKLKDLLQSGGSIASEIKLEVDTFTCPSTCPSGIAAIEEPDGAVIRLKTRRVGSI